MAPGRQEMIYAPATIALTLLRVPPDSHDFSVVDLQISYGYRARPKINLALLIFLAIILPIIAVAITSLYPFRSIHQSESHPFSSSVRLRKLNIDLLGLGVSLATATVVLNIKNLAGVPRPDFLERCRPDMNNINANLVGGGYGRVFSKYWVIVSREICQADEATVNEGFRSFPSGYATIAFAGLWYLTLYLSATLKLAEIHPTWNRRANSDERNSQNTRGGIDRNAGEHDTFIDGHSVSRESGLRLALSASPAYLLILPYLSLGLAIFIAGSRYFDFRNHGFDVLAGAAADTACASFAFRIYGTVYSF